MTVKRKGTPKATIAPEQAATPEQVAGVDLVAGDAVGDATSEAWQIVVKNSGLRPIFEPCSQTTLSQGATAKIVCVSAAQFKSVRQNIDQLKALGASIEVQHD